MQPWQSFMGVLAALKDKPYAWLWLGSKLGWPEGLDFLKLLPLHVLWFPCRARLGACSQSCHHGVSRKGELEGCCPPELTLSGTS